MIVNSDHMSSEREVNWHSLSVEQCLEKLSVDKNGLTEEEATRRLDTHGPNALPSPATTPVWQRFVRNFKDPLVIFLLIAAAIAALVAQWVDAAVILSVVIINAIIAFIQEGKAEESLKGLRSILAPITHVVRDGQRKSVAVESLVPGDVVLLEAGDRVPADARLISAHSLRVDESVLTGESVTVEKTIAEVATDIVLGDRFCMLFSGTLIAAGQAMAVVTETGVNTQIGHIGRLIAETEELDTPLLQQVARFSKAFAIFAMFLALALFIFAVLFRDYSWVDALMLVVAITVGLVPESLLAVITITLALGVRRMAARNAIVRRLPAVETLGATTVICSDKTGTLTRNEMTIRTIVTKAGAITVEGSGYEPVGALEFQQGQTGTAVAAAEWIAKIGCLCGDARLYEKEQQWHVEGDPMEGALHAYSIKANQDPRLLKQAYPRVDVVPFDAEYRFMATLNKARLGEQDELLILVKGAPEQLLALSRTQFSADGGEEALDRDYWLDTIEKIAEQGQRVLGFAYRRLTSDLTEPFCLDSIRDLHFVGIAGFIDPPRAEVIDAVADCREAGIDVKMITGDHEKTAAAIARQLGQAEDLRVLTGQQLDEVPDAQLPKVAEETSVFARTTPEHKLRIVRSLQSLGHVVAMTGDGVNDAPSLKQADIGIAMGNKGTEAAKEASQMVLTDDNFATINAAVYEGRAIYDNIRKVIAWSLATNGGEAIAIILALLIGLILPMSAVQILWINVVLTVTLALSLSFEPAEKGVMQSPPRKTGAALVSPFMAWRIVFVSILFSAFTFGIFQWALNGGRDVETARTMVVNMFCMLEIAYLFCIRQLRLKPFSPEVFKGTAAVRWSVLAVIVLQILFTYLPFLNMVFESRPLSVFEWSLIIVSGIVFIVIMEIEKAILQRYELFEEMTMKTKTKSAH